MKNYLVIEEAECACVENLEEEQLTDYKIDVFKKRLDRGEPVCSICDDEGLLYKYVDLRSVINELLLDSISEYGNSGIRGAILNES